jgi:hypothetical protein
VSAHASTAKAEKLQYGDYSVDVASKIQQQYTLRTVL